GYDRKMGARPIKRLIKEKIAKPLANEILFGELTQGGHAIVRVLSDDLTLEFAQKGSPTPAIITATTALVGASSLIH
ncbi:MAG: hypothetical protein FJ161_05030, partial [Gammaproteobacteria bacterium]|nr:hypothetical protein [Gammaproteobacteria bacterium]